MVPLSGCTSLYCKGIGMDKKKSASEMMLQSAFAFYGMNSTPKYFFVKQNFKMMKGLSMNASDSITIQPLEFIPDSIDSYHFLLAI